MFVVVRSCEKPKAGLLRRIFIRSSDDPQPSLCVAGGARYYTLPVAVKDGVAQGAALRELYPRFCGRLIAGRGIALPEELSPLLFNSGAYSAEIMLRAAQAVSEMLPLPLIRRSIGLIDPTGGYSAYAEELIKYAPIVKIYTERYDSYADTQARIFELYGAPLIVTERLASLSDCAMIFSPQDTLFLQLAGYTKPIVFGGIPYTLGGRRFVQRNIISLCEMNIPPALFGEMPENADPLLVLSAMYELCGKRELARQTPLAFLAGDMRLEASALKLYIYRLCKQTDLHEQSSY